MATNLFSRAAAYRKKHKHLTQAEAVQILSKQDKKKPAKRKSATVGRARKKKASGKKAAAPAPRKVKVKIKPGKKGSSSITIGKAKAKKKHTGFKINFGLSGVHVQKVTQELGHKHGLEQALTRHKGLLKEKGLSAGEKASIRRYIKGYSEAIRESKRHISALKRGI